MSRWIKCSKCAILVEDKANDYEAISLQGQAFDLCISCCNDVMEVIKKNHKASLSKSEIEIKLNNVNITQEERDDLTMQQIQERQGEGVN